MLVNRSSVDFCPKKYKNTPQKIQKWSHGFSPKKIQKMPQKLQIRPQRLQKGPIRALLSFLGSFLYFFRGKTVGNFIFQGIFIFS
jgi:hypothetical protein